MAIRAVCRTMQRQQRAVVAITCVVLSGLVACDKCTEEEKRRVAQGLTHLAIIHQLNAKCGFKTPIDVSPLVFYTHPCFHDKALRDAREQCSYAISVIYDGLKYCEALLLPGEDAPRVRVDGPAIALRGKVRVLVVAVDRASTSVKDDLGTELVQAQAVINQELANYSANVGANVPIAQFENTNVLVRAADLETDGITVYASEPALRARLDAMFATPDYQRYGYKTGDFDVVLVLALEPHRDPPVGGGAWSQGRTIVAWWFEGSSQSSFVDVTPTMWWTIINAAYGHEMEHLAGWPGHYPYPITGGTTADQRNVHYWPSYVGAAQGIWVAPALLGWEDSNRNGIVDALDPEPYTR